MKKKTHRVVKTSVKLISLIVLLILLVTITICATFLFKDAQTVTSTTYHDSGSLSTSVCLKSNDFIEAACYDDTTRSYINALINNIKVDLNANLLASNILATDTYQYKIEAQVLANEKGDSTKVVYDNSEVLVSGGNTTTNDTGYTLKKSVNVDFQKYNNTITDFKKNYVLALDSNLIIKATVVSSSSIKDTGESIEVNKTISLTIPLSEQTVNINMDKAKYEEQTTKIITSKNDSFFKEKNIISLLYIIDAIFILLSIIYIVKLLPKKNVYHAQLNKILKEYDRAVAITKNIPSFKGLKIIAIDSFTELLDVKDNLDKPILLYQDDAKEEAEFFIITGHEVYLYVLSAYEDD